MDRLSNPPIYDELTTSTEATIQDESKSTGWETIAKRSKEKATEEDSQYLGITETISIIGNQQAGTSRHKEDIDIQTDKKISGSPKPKKTHFRPDETSDDEILDMLNKDTAYLDLDHAAEMTASANQQKEEDLVA